MQILPTNSKHSYLSLKMLKEFLHILYRIDITKLSSVKL